ncbi:MAG TPA: hypothetical protein PKV16_02025 [Caldisericia bacterium]|nr:hypothetical protein [Caldisericia bacterium]HPI83973.1 hypothetical protein [Caldisericia bacterium]HPQ92543.1 hypothetical protein [Caldisericia bacterium]HRV74359.1 hypothetical protein [Caldisericia bacterium]
MTEEDLDTTLEECSKRLGVPMETVADRMSKCGKKKAKVESGCCSSEESGKPGG